MRNPSCMSLVTMLALAGIAAADRPSIVSMGVLPGASSSSAIAVTADGAAAIGQSGSFGFRWTAAEGIASIGVLSGYDNSHAAAISDDGNTVVGFSTFTANHHPCATALRWTPSGLKAFLGMQSGSAASAITPDGHVIGGYRWGCFSLMSRSYRWTSGGGAQNLSENLLEHNPVVRAMSVDGNVIVGAAFPTTEYSAPAWRWTQMGGVEGLPLLPQSTGCSAHAITRDGALVAGDCYFGIQGTIVRPVLWTAAGIQSLPHWQGWNKTSLRGLNVDGTRAVGSASHMAQSIAVIWDDGVLKDLNQWLSGRGVNLFGWHLEEATAINPAGDVIVGTGMFNGERRAFIATVGCYANCDGSTAAPVLNIEDFTCFINEFAIAFGLPHEQQIEAYANCDQSTTAPVLNVEDFTCFINAFAAGCP